MTVDIPSSRLLLRNQIVDALEAQGKKRTVLVDVGRQTPSTLVDVLYDFVYSKEAAGAGSRTFVPLYYDKSRGEPFPLYCLSRGDWMLRETLRRTVSALPVALMSMRHLQMDAFVYMAWFLNSDIARCGTNAEVESFCYKRTRAQIQEGLREGPLKLHVYQTGFPPAIIGFYRGLIDELRQRSDQPPLLEVTPYYYSPTAPGYRPGMSWD